MYEDEVMRTLRPHLRRNTRLALPSVTGQYAGVYKYKRTKGLSPNRGLGTRLS
jgi:hypothetical protein